MLFIQNIQNMWSMLETLCLNRYLNDLMKVIVSVSAFGQKFTLAFNLSPAFVQKTVEVIMAI